MDQRPVVPHGQLMLFIGHLDAKLRLRDVVLDQTRHFQPFARRHAHDAVGEGLGDKHGVPARLRVAHDDGMDTIRKF